MRAVKNRSRKGGFCMKYVKKSVKELKKSMLKFAVCVAALELFFVTAGEYTGIWLTKELVMLPLSGAALAAFYMFAAVPFCLFLFDKNYKKTGNISCRVFDCND
jgi:hypothetical protein